MTDKAAHTATLRWRSPDRTPSCIEVWPAGAERAGVMPLACGTGHETQQVVLSGLQPETRYAYRVHAGEVGDAAIPRRAAQVYEFMTGSPIDGTRHFAVMGDSHGNRPVIQGLLAHALQTRPSLDFLLHVGDAVNDGSVAGSWSKEFVEPARAFLSAAPMRLAMGNHDKGVPPPFLAPGDAHTVFPTVLSFTSGSTFILVADTNQDFSVGSPQHRDLEQRLSAPEAVAATWRFVAFHHAPFVAGWGTCDGYDGEPKVREVLVPLLTRHGVDVVFNGHVHGYERGTWQGVTYVSSGGGGGALDHACVAWPHIAVARYVHHILGVDVADTHLAVTAWALDGTVLDRFEMQK